MATKTVGRFTFDPADGTVSGPAEYMREQGNARLARIERGGSVADRMIIERAPDFVTGILVVLQTDYAGWHGSRQLFGEGALAMDTPKQPVQNAMGAAWLSAAEQEAFEEAAFRAWMRKVDALLLRKLGVSSADLADACYRDWHEDGLSPAQAVRLLREEGAWY